MIHLELHTVVGKPGTFDVVLHDELLVRSDEPIRDAAGVLREHDCPLVEELAVYRVDPMREVWRGSLHAALAWRRCEELAA